MSAVKRSSTEEFEGDTKRPRGSSPERSVGSVRSVDIASEDGERFAAGDFGKEIRLGKNFVMEEQRDNFVTKAEVFDVAKESQAHGKDNFVKNSNGNQDIKTSLKISQYNDKEVKEICKDSYQEYGESSNIEKKDESGRGSLKGSLASESCQEQVNGDSDGSNNSRKISAEGRLETELCHIEPSKSVTNNDAIFEQGKARTQQADSCETDGYKRLEMAKKEGEKGERKVYSSENNQNQEGEQAVSKAKVWRTSVEAGVAEDKGCRHTMEDAWTILMNDSSQQEKAKFRCSHFAVYDGHGGRKAADYAKRNLYSAVSKAGLSKMEEPKLAKKAIIEGIKKLDEELLKASALERWGDGATAVCVWILGQMVFVANLGDAKAVLARSPAVREGEREGEAKGIVITREHKAIFPGERARIEKAGGFVAKDGRLMGRVEVSRALGDRPFKQVGLSAIADVAAFELTHREKFLILGCDGLWGVYSAGDAVEFVEKQLKERVSVDLICKRLVREAVRERRCKDNCTALLVLFKHEIR